MDPRTSWAGLQSQPCSKAIIWGGYACLGTGPRETLWCLAAEIRLENQCYDLFSELALTSVPGLAKSGKEVPPFAAQRTLQEKMVCSGSLGAEAVVLQEPSGKSHS